MGSLAQVAKSFDGANDELEAQKEVVQSLSALADAKLATYSEKVANSYLTAGSPENPTFPIKLMTGRWSRTHAYSESSATALADNLKEAVKGFLSGSADGVTNGIFSIVNSALTALFVDSSAEENSDTLYFVYCKDDTVTRLDMYSWYRNVTATAITKKIQKVSCFHIQQATIDCTRVGWYDYMAVVKASYATLGLTKEQYDAAVAKAENDYVKGGGKIPPSNTANTVEPHPDLNAKYKAMIASTSSLPSAMHAAAVIY